MDHQNIRGRIYQHILENPGTSFSRIIQFVGVGNGTGSYHLQILEANGLIKSMKKGKGKFFFISGVTYPYKLQSKLSLTEMETLRVLVTEGTLFITQIAAKINRSIQTASVSVRSLEKKNFVMSWREDQFKLCKVTPKGARYFQTNLK